MENINKFSKKDNVCFIEIQKNSITEDLFEEIKNMGKSIIDVLVEAGLSSSKTNARRLIEQNGVSINNTIINSICSRLVLDKETGVYAVISIKV